MPVAPPATRLYRAAWLCGLLPLTVGIAIYLVWELTQWNPLLLAGLVTLYAGTVCVAVGLVCVLVDAVTQRRAGISWGPVARRGAKPAGVLLLNLPVGLVILALVLLSLTRFTVVLRNESSEVISRFELAAPGVEEVLEGLAPGTSASVAMHFDSQGELAYTAEVGGRVTEGIIEGYVSSNTGGRSTVTFSDGVFRAGPTEWH